jgi:GNAT superfamily N-acetyltransferase
MESRRTGSRRATERNFVQDPPARAPHPRAMFDLRPCRDDDFAAILAIVNSAAAAYRGVIPPDCWHDPYMPREKLAGDIRGGVRFWACEEAGELLGVMGIQQVRDVQLIRHAYVRPDRQRGGVGAALLEALKSHSPGRLLVGTWRAASWAIAFYRRHGFALLADEPAHRLLAEYWRIPERQMETSVVLELSRPV